jgi:hypothetical protein
VPGQRTHQVEGEPAGSPPSRLASSTASLPSARASASGSASFANGPAPTWTTSTRPARFDGAE